MLPAQTDVVLTSDGHWLAWVDQTQEKPRVIMYDLVAHKVQRAMALPERLKIRALSWNDTTTLLITLSETNKSGNAAQVSQEYFLTTAYDVTGGEGRMLPSANGRARAAEAAVYASLVRTHINKPHTVIMQSRIATHEAALSLLEVDTDTGAAQPIKYGAKLTVGWVVDRNGKPVAREDWDWIKGAYRLYAVEGESLREILRQDDNERPAVAGLLPDDSALVLLANRGRPHRAAWALPLNGAAPILLAEDPAGDIGGTLFDSYSGAPVAVFVEGTKSGIHWLDPAAQQRYEKVGHAFPGKDVDLYGWTSDGSRALARVESPSSPPVYYLIDFASHRADIAGEAYPKLSGVKLGEVRDITFKARDGTPIPAYLTLPPVHGSEPLPMVVLPHGGPQARDYPTFDWLAQFLASRGYVVLQPQFRGSTGFGEAFEKAGYRQWGGLMQDDVTDGVQAMIEQKIADPHRVAIAGMSYGGYAALAGAAFTPQLYACAISVNGISDLPGLLQEKIPSTLVPHWRVYSNTQADIETRIGTATDSRLSAKSPIRAVDAIRIPVQIIYGSGDGIVPNEQSERMAQALRSAGKPVTVVKLPDEDHWLSRSDTRLQMLTEMERFLKDHL